MGEGGDPGRTQGSFDVVFRQIIKKEKRKSVEKGGRDEGRRKRERKTKEKREGVIAEY